MADLTDIGSRPLSSRGPFRFNLNWEPQGHHSRHADLDIGCLYVGYDASPGVVQSIRPVDGLSSVDPTVVRDDRGRPLIELDRDSQDGLDRGGETLVVHRPNLVSFMIVFASIYGGSTDFRHVRATLRMWDGPDPIGAARLATPAPGLNWCAIVAVGQFDHQMWVVHEERYFQSAHHADRHYGFGISWCLGTKAAPGPPGGD